MSVLSTFSSLKASHYVKHYGYDYEAGMAPGLKELTNKQEQTHLYIALAPHMNRIGQAA